MDITMLSRLKNATNIYKKYNIDSIFLVWSYSRWEETENSDIDLYLKTKSFLDIYKYMNLKFDLEKELWKKVDLIMDDNLKSGVKDYLLKDLVLIK